MAFKGSTVELIVGEGGIKLPEWPSSTPEPPGLDGAYAISWQNENGALVASIRKVAQSPLVVESDYGMRFDGRNSGAWTELRRPATENYSVVAGVNVLTFPYAQFARDTDALPNGYVWYQDPPIAQNLDWQYNNTGGANPGIKSITLLTERKAGRYLVECKYSISSHVGIDYFALIKNDSNEIRRVTWERSSGGGVPRVQIVAPVNLVPGDRVRAELQCSVGGINLNDAYLSLQRIGV